MPKSLPYARRPRLHCQCLWASVQPGTWPTANSRERSTCCARRRLSGAKDEGRIPEGLS